MSADSPLSPPAPTDRVQEIEARLAKAIGWMAAGGRFTAGSTRSMCEDIEYLLARVRSLEAEREKLTNALRIIAEDFNHEGSEHYHQPMPRSETCRVCIAQRALAAHPLEAPANGQ